MSVAFRRESDDEHLEPKFELPIPAGPNLVTARGLQLIRERRAALEARLKGCTDPDQTTVIQRDLRYWTTREITAELAPTPSGNKVEFGTTVDILLQGKPRTLRIVGDDEADPAEGLVSFNAPLSRAMLGAEPGDLLSFGGAADAIEVLNVEVTSA
ncbi:nucleoside-diphosphate kinase [Altererythrobacter soli]|uniref:Nucleoside-diphosphate kinase n=1 Tax=Croceibacterium soli TaxID=1739690 RepID=A0A6I4USW5_9SPHN|nr:GreA/GreB family elongation factor [Croceibacterium soli]MXP42020.1 nucleoside-diphosphate kinase [Croceibacterium soli]